VNNKDTEKQELNDAVQDLLENAAKISRISGGLIIADPPIEITTSMSVLKKKLSLLENGQLRVQFLTLYGFYHSESTAYDELNLAGGATSKKMWIRLAMEAICDSACIEGCDVEGLATSFYSFISEDEASVKFIVPSVDDIE